MISDAEWNSILYYADFIALKKRSTPVTDTCKYFFVYGTPMNISYIVGNVPEYDIEDEYLQEAINEYIMLFRKFGRDGVESYIEDLGCIHSCGMVDAIRMLNCIHQYSDYGTKKHAYEVYNNWKNNLKYTHDIVDDGEKLTKECSKYIYHFEQQHGKDK